MIAIGVIIILLLILIGWNIDRIASNTADTNNLCLHDISDKLEAISNQLDGLDKTLEEK